LYSLDAEIFTSNFEDFVVRMRESVFFKLREWGIDVRDSARMNAPYDTGRLENSIQAVTVKVNEWVVKVEVSANTPYARIQELGGVITPKHAKVLAWVTHGDRPTTPEGWKAARQEGRARFAKSVYIPSQPYIYPAFKYNEQNLAEKLKEAFLISAREVQ